MSPAPRVFIVRHGETEWTLSGQYTGSSEIPLTDRGIEQVRSTSRIVFGSGKLIDPSRLAKIFVSPRERAQKTLEVLFEGVGNDVTASVETETIENLKEWSYGKYEGLLTKEIRAGRKERGLDQEREWDIWRDGCEGGESSQQVAERLDSIIAEIRQIQEPHLNDDKAADVLLVAHGHILRAFVKRWLGYTLDFKLLLILEPGGVGVLTYDHRSIKEPAVLVGLGFPLHET